MRPLVKHKLSTHWNRMPKGMQLKFISSDHKSRLDSIEVLNAREQNIAKQYESSIPLPDVFLGYEFKPKKYQFYSVNPGNFADKFEARLEHGSWKTYRLEP